MLRKRLPPYAKQLQPLDGAIFLFVGYHRYVFPLARNLAPNACCLPLYADPNLYRWPVAGCRVVLFHWFDIPEYLQEVYYELLTAQAEAVYSYFVPENRLLIYR